MILTDDTNKSERMQNNYQFLIYGHSKQYIHLSLLQIQK